MDLGLSDEQRMLQDMVRDLCEDRFPLTALRRLESDEDGLDRDFWHALADQGLCGISIAEAHGGHGLGLLECALVHEQFGYHLAQSPHLVSSVLAASFIEAAGGASLSAALLPGIADGSRIVAIASSEAGRGEDLSDQQAVLRRDAKGVRISGTKHFVSFASIADDLIVFGREKQSGRMLALAVSPGSDGITLRRQQTMASEPCFEVQFEDVFVPSERVFADGADATEAWRAAMSKACVVIAAAATGAARRIHEISTAYAKEREAFGKPIGAFQAIAHYLADAIVEIEGARVLYRNAAWMHDEARPYALEAAIAKLQACNIFRRASALGIQVHGGLGYPTEADPQLFYRRAKQWQILNGSEAWLTEEISRLDASGGYAGV